MNHTISNKIENRDAIVAVMGLGYVGLPLALAFAERGFKTIGFDISEMTVEQVKNGETSVLDVSNHRLQMALSEGKLVPTSDPRLLSQVDAVIICVPTPLTSSHEPDVSAIESAVSLIKAHIIKPVFISLESTTYPGCTREVIVKPLVETGKHLDEDLFICFSPERVDPGNALYHTENTPKVVGGISEASIQIGEMLYKQVIDQVVVVSSPEVAEMSKLLENTFRCVNIAFMNEMSLMCDRLGIDIWETLDAAETKPFGFMRFNPGPGVGGHCIPLDPMYLSWKAKQTNFFSRFIETAQDINSNMPKKVVEKATNLLNEQGAAISKSKILLLGMSYKKNINDLRESPSLEVYEELLSKNAIVEYCDPYVPFFKTKSGVLQNSLDWETLHLKDFDLVILLTNHTDFDREKINREASLLLDTRHRSSHKMPVH
ncbi:nucleotide sugar dehydrogenase [Listeria aquatica]|uniref:nucleotide sugar dehydrogenase n=1 Tax=Listeria aquatica TaxID=1494960 RepID=UPI003F6F4789